MEAVGSSTLCARVIAPQAGSVAEHHFLQDTQMHAAQTSAIQ